MINYCKTCTHEGEEIGVCSTCFYNHILDERDMPPTEYEKKRSNADRIRSMSDEELADEILSWFNWLNAVEWDDKRIIEWLKQEVSTNG